MADNWWTVIAGTIMCLLCGVAWGLFNGFCIAKLKVPPLITTLGTLGAALGVRRADQRRHRRAHGTARRCT